MLDDVCGSVSSLDLGCEFIFWSLLNVTFLIYLRFVIYHLFPF